MKKLLISTGQSQEDNHQEYVEWSLWRLALSMAWRVNLIVLAFMIVLNFIVSNFEIVK